MGALLSKNNTDKADNKSPKTTKRSTKKRGFKAAIAQLQLDASASAANTTGMTSLADDSLLLAQPPQQHQAADQLSSELNTPAKPPAAASQFVDPRSPFVCRTPIGPASPAGAAAAPITRQLDLTSDLNNGDPTTPIRQLPGASKQTALQQKLLKNLGYQACDPRSPTQFINRTPMRLAAGEGHHQLIGVVEMAVERSVESTEADNSPTVEEEEDCNAMQDDSLQAAELDVSDKVSENVTPETDAASAEDANVTPPPSKQTAVDVVVDEEQPSIHGDPRSPSINVERTPIVGQDTVDARSDESVDNPAINDEENIAPLMPPPAPVADVAAIASAFSPSAIFQDAENVDVQPPEAATAAAVPSLAVATPRKQAADTKPRLAEAPRTPLGCLGNQRAQLNGGGRQLLSQKKLAPGQQQTESRIPVAVHNGGAAEGRRFV